MIEVKSLKFAYRDVPVLKDISFSAGSGEFVALLGPNGVGKSTLFRCMLGLLHPSSGSVLLDGAPVSELAPGARAKKIAYIPQFTTPVYNYTVLEAVLMGVAGQLNYLSNPSRNHVETAEAALERLGIGHLKNRGFGRISGGERQLALLARALVQNAGVLIMDEPTASLDYGNQHRVLSIIKELCGDGYTVLLSTHNPDVAFQYATRAVMLLGGTVIADGEPREALSEQVISTAYQMTVELQTLNTVSGPMTVCVPLAESGNQQGDNYMYVWTKDRINWYDRAVHYTGFSDKLADLLATHIPLNESVCDLGCGTGHLAMAMAKRSYRIKAADRHPLVLDFLRRESKRQGLDVEVVGADWHTLTPSLADNVIMVFAGRLDTELSFYLELCAKRLFLVVKNSPQSHVKNNGETSPSYASRADLAQSLNASGLTYQIEEHTIEFGQPLCSLEEAEAYIASFNKAGFHSKQVTDRLVKYDDPDFPLYLPNEKRVALIVIDKPPAK